MLRFFSGLMALVAAAAAPAVAATPTADYRVTFDATWSEQTHPVDFPDNPHFSPLVGGTHTDRAHFWEPGGEATPGIELMAERGQTAALRTEIEAAIDAGDAEQVILGSGIGTSPGSVSVEFSVSQEHPQLTLVSMLAPSPDWFVGVHGLALFDGATWVREQVVPLRVYDAGTDSGISFTSGDADTSPQEPISVIDMPPLGADGVGTFTITRTDAPPEPVPAPPWQAGALGALLLAGLLARRSRSALIGQRSS